MKTFGGGMVLETFRSLLLNITIANRFFNSKWNYKSWSETILYEGQTAGLKGKCSLNHWSLALLTLWKQAHPSQKEQIEHSLTTCSMVWTLAIKWLVGQEYIPIYTASNYISHFCTKAISKVHSLQLRLNPSTEVVGLDLW